MNFDIHVFLQRLPPWLNKIATRDGDHARRLVTLPLLAHMVHIPGTRSTCIFRHFIFGSFQLPSPSTGQFRLFFSIDSAQRIYCLLYVPISILHQYSFSVLADPRKPSTINIQWHPRSLPPPLVRYLSTLAANRISPSPLTPNSSSPWERNQISMILYVFLFSLQFLKQSVLEMPREHRRNTNADWGYMWC